MMCNGEFMGKEPDDVDMQTENAQSQDTSYFTEKPNQVSQSKGGMYLLREEDGLKGRVAHLTMKLEAMESRTVNSIKTTETVKSLCGICGSEIPM